MTLAELAAKLNLPSKFLLAEAKAGTIPYLRTGRGIRFHPSSVERALSERSAQTAGEVSDAK